jgi:UDP-N-acetylmuramate--alanine ligase
MDLTKITRVYFIGIGGIGMSALARYFIAGGFEVAGYDRNSTFLTDELINENCNIHFEDNIRQIPEVFKDDENERETLVIYTPAIPENNSELTYFRNKKYNVLKRSEVLGLITKNAKSIAVAGTHGKTTISAIVTYILKQSELDCTAFLGGISKNYNTNFLLGESEFIVMEADEFDRSFLQLYPYITVITSIDADHLDIYGDKQNLKESFKQFVSQISDGGKLLTRKDLEFNDFTKCRFKHYTYSLDSKADFYARNLDLKDGLYVFDIVTPGKNMEKIHFGFPGLINVENAVAAAGVAWILKIPPETIRKALLHFDGVKRRFDFKIRSENIIFIDDYAHHPEELNACIRSVRELFPGKKITGIFQPHLYTRTMHFASEFASSLTNLDELILLEIYPAREMPIKGISSKIIFDKVKLHHKIICRKNKLLELIKSKNFEILITLGAGDIDTLVEPIKNMLLDKYGLN